MARRINLVDVNVARSNTIRDINRQIILNYIREEGPISRASIAQTTELQRSTVSLIVDELLKASLVEEIYGESSGGRPPQLLSLKTINAVAIGIDLGKKFTKVATCDLSGRLIEKCSFSTSRDFNTTITNITDTCKRLIKNNSSIEGIGISLPGMVESWNGRIVNIPHLDWQYPKIIEKIYEATGIPVLVENDTNAIALAELWLGRPEIRNVRDFVVVLIDEGIGTGIVFDGQLYRGKDGVAGEFGHMTIGSNAPIACAAGKTDCWEAFASERSAVARYIKLQGENPKQDKILFNELIERAINGDENAVKSLKETAYYIGVGISNMVQGLSPEVTIVVGNITNAWSLISEELNRSTENAVCQGFPKVNIMPSTLGELPSLMGAFSLVLANKFSSFRIN